MEHFLTERTLQDLTGDIESLQTTVNSGSLPAWGATAATDDLNAVYTSQKDRSVAFVIGQQEANRATDTTDIHFVLSVRHNANYGYQYEFIKTHIYYRPINAGTWGAWQSVV